MVNSLLFKFSLVFLSIKSYVIVVNVLCNVVFSLSNNSFHKSFRGGNKASRHYHLQCCMYI